MFCFTTPGFTSNKLLSELWNKLLLEDCLFGGEGSHHKGRGPDGNDSQMSIRIIFIDAFADRTRKKEDFSNECGGSNRGQVHVLPITLSII